MAGIRSRYYDLVSHEINAHWTLSELLGELRERQPLRDDAWAKGYHAALHDIDVATLVDPGLEYG